MAHAGRASRCGCGCGPTGRTVQRSSARQEPKADPPPCLCGRCYPSVAGAPAQRSLRRCRYGQAGCVELLPPHQLDAHERDCGFKPTRCRICSCALPVRELWVHVAHAHGDDATALGGAGDFHLPMMLFEQDGHLFWAFKKNGGKYVGMGVEGVTSTDYEFRVSVVTGDGYMACDFTSPVSAPSICHVSKRFLEVDSVCTIEIYQS